MKTLAQYLFKRIADENTKFRKNRQQKHITTPSGLFITADDIDRYIREYVLTKKGTVGDSPYEIE
jgi:hypothetical protein